MIVITCDDCVKHAMMHYKRILQRVITTCICISTRLFMNVIIKGSMVIALIREHTDNQQRPQCYVPALSPAGFFRCVNGSFVLLMYRISRTAMLPRPMQMLYIIA